jgi:hypothetical protein
MVHADRDGCVEGAADFGMDSVRGPDGAERRLANIPRATSAARPAPDRRL